MTKQAADTTHFGFETVATSEKAGRVRGVFDSVASNYDLMNDLMSGGLHRIWKQFTLAQTGLRPGDRALDVACGTGDLAAGLRTNCAPYPNYWIVTGGTGRFEDASGVMSNAATDHPAYLTFATGQLSVRADRWADVVPPTPATEPDPAVEFLEVAYFEGIVSSTSTTAPAGDCDRSDPDVVVCTSMGTGELRATLLGDATNTWTGTTTQLVDSSCELDDGTTAVPAVVDATGTITSQRGDELSYVSRANLDPCATEGSGAGGTTSYWRATGGTGRFADAHGLISGVATPGLGFEAIGAGTLSVRADQWLQLAAEYATLPAGDDYIELRYWERFLFPDGGVGMQIEPPDDCDTTEPGLEICDYRLTGNLTGTHIGAASEIQTGTITRRLDDTCPTGGIPSLRQGTGAITTPWGDDLHLRTLADSCEIAFWVLDGGTGRFDSARGVMTGLSAFEMGDDTALIQSGTFHLRADLWTDLIPGQN